VQRPPLPAKTTPMYACRPERGWTALAPLSVKQSCLRSSPHSPHCGGFWTVFEQRKNVRACENRIESLGEAGGKG
jgi:hypothetical protein